MKDKNREVKNISICGMCGQPLAPDHACNNYEKR